MATGSMLWSAQAEPKGGLRPVHGYVALGLAVGIVVAGPLAAYLLRAKGPWFAIGGGFVAAKGLELLGVAYLAWMVAQGAEEPSSGPTIEGLSKIAKLWAPVPDIAGPAVAGVNDALQKDIQGPIPGWDEPEEHLRWI